MVLELMKVSADGTQKFKFTSANRCRVDISWTLLQGSLFVQGHCGSSSRPGARCFQAGRSATEGVHKQKITRKKEASCLLASDNKDDFWSPSGLGTSFKEGFDSG
jgi:hypothetical protein